MRICVTGGTGFIGSNIVIKLQEQGHELVITGSDAEQDIPGFSGQYLQPGFLGLDWDALGEVDMLFHQAAINDASSKNEKEVFRANVDASLELFRRAIEKGCKKIIYASSTAAYGNVSPPFKEDGPMEPTMPYGKSKLLLDREAMRLAQEYPDVLIVGLRYSNVYGPREDHKRKRASMVYQFARQMQKGNPVVFGDGEQKRDFIYVDDVVRANLLAAEAGESCVVNCGTGTAVSFNQIINILNDVMGLEREIEYVENPYKDYYQTYTECDMSLAKEKIGFIPEIAIEEGIKKYYDSGYIV